MQLQVGVHQLDGMDTTVDVPPRDLQLYGPGDIVGVDTRTVIRTEPRNGVTNFEPNFLAAIEFYDEDLPWRYTPAAPVAEGARLVPWLALVVLKEGEEFDEGGDVTERPLPYITVKNNARQFPDPAALWAWAHVHVNRGLTANEAEIITTDRAAVATRLAATVQENPDLAYSRIVCPRRLAANTNYHAFLVPAFESGRLAGLGLDPSTTPSAMAPAWTGNGAESDSFPVYFRWQFRTGDVGDFEYLVRLLRPVPVDRSVGVRDLDVQEPGPALAGISDPALHGVLPLGGALRVPRSSLDEAERAEAERTDNWARPYPHAFQKDLASLLNLADSYAGQTAAQANAATGLTGFAGDVDPVVVPPLYGRWHAQTPRLLTRADGTPLPNSGNWVHELNLDPRHRAAAGLGTRVVQSKQEDLMAAAWQQVGAVLEANQRLRRLMFAQQISFVWHRAQLQPLVASDPAKALTLTAPVHGRVMTTASAPVTMRARVARSAVPPVLVSSAMRRAVRPRTRLMRSLPFDSRARPGNLIARVNAGEVVTAPPKVVPPGVAKVSDVASSALPANVPAWLVRWLRRSAWRAYLPLLIALVLALLLWIIGVFIATAGAVLLIGAAVTAALLALRRSILRADALLEGSQTQASVEGWPASSDFVFTDVVPGTEHISLAGGGQDNPESVRFKTALKDLNALLEASVAADTVGENGPRRQRLNIAREARIAVAAIDPAVTLPRRAAAAIRVPARIQQEQPETFTEAMAYPVFDIPMYRPLADISAELLIPNVNRIENNSVTLLETNQKFVESYMVGLNHELARELLWREYPTDQRGSYFRQFWDVSSFFAGAGEDPEALRERLRDIPPLHRWSRSSRLGDHDARERPGDQEEEEVVLVIRGELLKRYPGAVIYAQAAEWARLPNGEVDRTKARSLVALPPGQEDSPGRDALRTPLYMAKIEPDISFLGFDLTVAAARGGTGERRDDPPGWFFVIKERPGEPRFGFDETSAPQIGVWNDLGWDRVPMAGESIKPLPGVAPGIKIPATLPAGQSEKEPQRVEDYQVRWDDTVSAAELAYILYQAPAMIAIHASELLTVA